MIFDAFDNWQLYSTGHFWDEILKFLLHLKEDTLEGEYPIKEGDIFGRVISYMTKDQEECILEAHRQFVDIQTVLKGAEGIALHSTRNLHVKTPYDEKNDVEIFIPPHTFSGRVELKVGQFVVLFPDDAHMPQLKITETPDSILKVVIKVRANLFLNTRGGSI